MIINNFMLINHNRFYECKDKINSLIRLMDLVVIFDATTDTFTIYKNRFCFAITGQILTRRKYQIFMTILHKYLENPPSEEIFKILQNEWISAS